MHSTICGSGAACEQVCPLMEVGRVCPTVRSVIEACETLRLDPMAVLAGRPA